jgi:hypothetical protein
MRRTSEVSAKARATLAFVGLTRDQRVVLRHAVDHWARTCRAAESQGGQLPDKLWHESATAEYLSGLVAQWL